MSPFGRQWSRPVCLLTVLWAVGRTGADQPPPPADAGTSPDPNLLKLISDEISFVVQPQVNNLTSRIDRLDSHLNDVETHLEEQSSRLNQQSSRLNQQSSRLNQQSSRLNQCSSRLNTLTNLMLQGPSDCSQLPAWFQSGIYQLRLNHFQPAVPAYCDKDTRGRWWTVIQRRADIKPRQDFYRYWSDYKNGFGDLNKEFWWGLEKVWQMTGATGRPHQLRIELADFAGRRRHALYGRFRVSSEADGYRLSVGGYSGNAGDSLIRGHSGMKFTTRDRDQDRRRNNCAQSHKGAWWFNSCYYSHLNGQYLPGKRRKQEGIIWYGWRGWYYSLKATVMKVRPVTTD